MSLVNSNDGIKKTIFKGIGSLYLTQLLGLPLSIVTNLVAVKFLAPMHYGPFVIASFIVTIACLVSEGGLSLALIRHPKTLTNLDYSFCFFYQFVVGGFLSLMLYSGSRFFVSSDVGAMLRLLCALPVILSLTTIPLVRMERELKYQMLASYSVLSSVLERSILLWMLIYTKEGSAFAYSRITGILFQAILYYSCSRWNPIASFLLAISKVKNWSLEFLHFGFMLQLKSLPIAIVTNLIPGLGGMLFSPGQVGVVSWSHNLATQLGQSLPQAVSRVMIGSSHRMSDETGGFQRFFGQALYMTTTGVGLVLAVTSATMHEIVVYFFRHGWEEVPLLFTVSSVVMIEGLLLVLLDAGTVIYGVPGVAVIANWIWAISSVPVCWFLARWIGPTGLVLGFVISTLVPIIFIFKKIRIFLCADLLRNYFGPLLVSVLVGFMTFYFKFKVVNSRFSLIGFDFLMFMIGLGLQAAFSPRLVASIRRFR